MAKDRGQWEMEYGMRIAGKEMVECLILIFSAFQLPHSKVPDT
jgi:hypothetical protein